MSDESVKSWLTGLAHVELGAIVLDLAVGMTTNCVCEWVG